MTKPIMVGESETPETLSFRLYPIVLKLIQTLSLEKVTLSDSIQMMDMMKYKLIELKQGSEEFKMCMEQEQRILKNDLSNVVSRYAEFNTTNKK